MNDALVLSATQNSMGPWMSFSYFATTTRRHLSWGVTVSFGILSTLEELLRNVPTSVITRRWNDTWSIQENAGHLLDLEGLWLARVRDLQVGKAELTEADLRNRQTWERNYNDASLAQILSSFRSAREELVGQLDGVDEAMMKRAARHPRLGNPMRLVDLAFFVAEHDDHHLARVTQLKHIFDARRR